MRGCGCFLVLGVIVIAAVVLVMATLRGPELRPVPTSHVQAMSAETKLTAVSAAFTKAKQTGQPVAFTETFTDGELSSLVNEHISASGVPLDGVILHSNAAGYVEGQAKARFAGQTLPVYLRANVVVKDGQASLHLVQSKLGFAPVPSQVSSQIDAALRQSVNLGTQAPIDNLKVVIGDGALTLAGVAKPAP